MQFSSAPLACWGITSRSLRIPCSMERVRGVTRIHRPPVQMGGFKADSETIGDSKNCDSETTIQKLFPRFRNYCDSETNALQKLRFRNYRDSETIAIQKLPRVRNYRDSETTPLKLTRFRNYDSETITIQKLRFRNFSDSETTLQKRSRCRNYPDSETIGIQKQRFRNYSAIQKLSRFRN